MVYNRLVVTKIHNNYPTFKHSMVLEKIKAISDYYAIKHLRGAPLLDVRLDY
jgi:hypothetical protein